MTSLHSSSGYSSILTLGPSRPALLTSTSILPKRSRVSPTILSTSALFDTSAPSASIFNLFGDRTDRLFAAGIDRHPGALSRKGERERLAEALASAGDERDFVF